MAISQQNLVDVSNLYVALFGRAPDGEGFDFWAGLLAGGKTVTEVADIMYATEPARTYYPADATSEAIISSMYLNVLGRAADTEGLAFWTAKLNTPGATAGSVLAEMVNVVVNYTGTDAAGLESKALFDNKAAVSLYTGMKKTTVEIAKTALTGVTSDVATVTTAEAAVDAAIDAVAPGQTFTLTDGVTGQTIVSTAANDTITGAASAYDSADQVIDPSTADDDTYNLSVTASATPIATNVENVAITVATTNGTNPTITASSLTGVKNLTVTGSNLTVGGSSIAGDKDIDIAALNATKVLKVTAGAGTKDVTIVQATKAGLTVDAAVATGNVAVTGAATIDAAASTGTVVAGGISDTTEDAKAFSLSAANVTSVNVGSNTDGATAVDNVALTGTIAVTAAKAAVVKAAVSGGATISALGGTTGIALTAIDDSGATITTSYVGTTTAAGVISVDGTTGTADVATVSAIGSVSLATAATQQVDKLNLSGNGAAVVYTLTGTPETTTLTGGQSVTLKGASASFTTKTVTDSTTAGTTTVALTTVADADLSKVGADLIQIAADGTNADLTVATGANVQIANDQTTSLDFIGKAADAAVNVSTGDDTAASGAAITISVGGFTAATNVKTVNLTATTGAFTSTGFAMQSATVGTLNVVGTKDVTLGTVSVGKEILASGLTGALSLTASGANTTKSITSGSGNDIIVLNQTVKFTVDAGNGDNQVTLTDVADASSVSTGAGADTITLTDTGSNVIVTGAGDDSVSVGGDADSIIVMGDGTGDALTLTAADFSDNTNFAFTGVEKITTAAAGTTTISAAQFAGDNVFQLLGTSATADILKVLNASTTAGAVIDATGVTFASTPNALLQLAGAGAVGGTSAGLADTITGSAKNDSIIATTGADVVAGGSGTDTFDVSGLVGATVEGTGTGTSVGVVVNMGTTSVTNTSVLAATGTFTADSITSVAAGKTAYLFAASASTNSAVQQTLSSLENVVGTTGNDYIVGSTNDNNITGGAGGDYINVGVGTDTVTFAADDTLTGAKVTSSAVSVVGADLVAGMGISDVIALYTAATVSDGNLAASTTELAAATAGLAALVTGNYDASAGTFAESAFNATTANDYLVQWADGTSIHSIVLLDQSAAIKLVGTAATDIFTIAAA